MRVDDKVATDMYPDNDLVKYLDERQKLNVDVEQEDYVINLFVKLEQELENVKHTPAKRRTEYVLEMVVPLILDILSASLIDYFVEAQKDMRQFIARLVPKCVELKANSRSHLDVDTVLFFVLRLMRRHPSICDELDDTYAFSPK